MDRSIGGKDFEKIATSLRYLAGVASECKSNIRYAMYKIEKATADLDIKAQQKLFMEALRVTEEAIRTKQIRTTPVKGR